MLDSFLNRQNKNTNEQANRVKYLHLMNQNGNLLKTISQLKQQLNSVRKINLQFQKDTTDAKEHLIEELTAQNHNLEQNMLRLIEYNQQLSCDILMKNQLICENQNQSRQIIANYEEKIYELRMSLQNKQLAVKNMEQKSVEQKQQLFGSTTKVNFVYFNQMNQMKILLDRYNVQNAQLKYLNSMKQEQISRLTDRLNHCQTFLKKSIDWSRYKQSFSQSTEISRSKEKKSQCKLKLCEELTHYDQSYKNLAISVNHNSNLAVNKLKSLATKYFQDSYNLAKDKKKLIQKLHSKNKQFKIIQEAYRKIDVELRNNKIQIQFYRDNFHQLTKVSKERRIHYYQEIYNKKIPKLKKKVLEKESLILYWKIWSKNHQMNLGLDERRTLGTKFNKNTKKNRNLSCICKFNHFIESQKTKVCADPGIQQAIINFINDGQPDNQNYNTAVAEHKQDNQQSAFKEDLISMIMKPRLSEQNNFKTAKFLDIDVELDEE